MILAFNLTGHIFKCKQTLMYKTLSQKCWALQRRAIRENWKVKTNDFDEPKNSLKSKSTVPKDLVMDCERIRNYLEVRHFTFSKKKVCKNFVAMSVSVFCNPLKNYTIDSYSYFSLGSMASKHEDRWGNEQYCCMIDTQYTPQQLSSSLGNQPNGTTKAQIYAFQRANLDIFFRLFER